MATPKKTKATNVESIERATSRTWPEWMAYMESIGAADLSHKQIAERVLDELEKMRPAVENPAWWSQGVTVAYEQQSGRRLPGQQADGTFQISVSRTVGLDMDAAMAKWVSFAQADKRLAALMASEPRTSGTNKRKNWRASATDGSALTVTTEPRANDKSALVAQQSKLASPEASEAAKEFWAEAMDRFVAGLP